MGLEFRKEVSSRIDSIPIDGFGVRTMTSGCGGGGAIFAVRKACT
jgi:hypothetical protein